ncbi:MAG TPA: peptidylprolyl isomerase [Flavipsychrobacter sp.]|nr:peptidylprolyl isomerase [Flavipsychrobacter sp.]
MKKIILLLCAFATTVAAFAQTHKVVIETDSGRIVMALSDNTPQHRDNMIKLVKEKFFDSTLFHRIIPTFVIQGGDPNSKRAKPEEMLGNGALGYLVPAEINDSNFHQRGALGMARDNNPEKASSACQFYIVVGKKYTDAELDMIAQRTGRQFTPTQREIYKTEGGTPSLDGNYTVFGIVTEGIEIVDKIVNMPRNQADRPNTDIAMRKVYMMDDKTEKKGRKKRKKI